MTLHGVIYLHSITDSRTGGISMRFLEVFRKICDADSLRNLVIAEWDMYDERRDKQFTDERLFKLAIHQGAHLFRHDNTIQSAQKLVRTICKNYSIPFNGRRELVNERHDPGITDKDTGNTDVISIAYVLFPTP